MTCFWIPSTQVLIHFTNKRKFDEKTASIVPVTQVVLLKSFCKTDTSCLQVTNIETRVCKSSDDGFIYAMLNIIDENKEQNRPACK